MSEYSVKPVAGAMPRVGGPETQIHIDPRRTGQRAMLAVWCWCSRFVVLTPEEATRRHAADLPPHDHCGTAGVSKMVAS